MLDERDSVLLVGDWSKEQRYQTVNANTSNENQPLMTIIRKNNLDTKPSNVFYPPSIFCPFLHRSIDYSMFVRTWQWYITDNDLSSINISINYARVCSTSTPIAALWNYITFISTVLLCKSVLKRVDCWYYLISNNSKIQLHISYSIHTDSKISTTKTGII